MFYLFCICVRTAILTQRCHVGYKNTQQCNKGEEKGESSVGVGESEEKTKGRTADAKIYNLPFEGEQNGLYHD